MNKLQSADSSEESDQDYIPPTKRSKSNNSNSDEDVTKGHEFRVDPLWEEFKNNSSTSKDKIKDSKLECEDRAVDDIQPIKHRVVSKKASSAPAKSRLDQLLRGKAQKKRERPENILNSSKRDWDILKTREQLSDELTHHNKDGFLERQDFLKRCEEREYDNLLESRSRKKK
ncbi:hypothetical protein LOD99_2760 [Oopsacas minuta]|uniref:BCNT-C domain-containing protein n=1 Tax=Oopsacas minuta TaxID=111878 RepID=A0AAV7K3N4_9METZ|nr:hypothetical protein LOD99_2760 [Oopsacas minuta]